MTRQVKGRTQPLLIQRTSHPGAQSRSTIRQAGLMNCNWSLNSFPHNADGSLPGHPQPNATRMIALGRIRVHCSSPTPATILALVYQSDIVDALGLIFRLEKPRVPPPLSANVAEVQGTCQRARHGSSTVELRGIYKRKGFCVDMKVGKC